MTSSPQSLADAPNQEEVEEEKVNKGEPPKRSYTRLEYEETDDGNFQLINNDKNKEILNKKKTTKKLSKLDILDLLSNYRPVKDIESVKFGNRRWYRYIIKGLDGKWTFRRGGFLIHRDMEKGFVVLVNVSQNFSFAVPLKNTILFESLQKKDNYVKKIKDFIKKYFTERDGNILVFINEDFTKIKSFKTQKEAINDTEFDIRISGLKKALRLGKFEYKKNLLNKVSEETLKNLTREYEELDIKKIFFNEEFKKIQQIIDNHIVK